MTDVAASQGAVQGGAFADRMRAALEPGSVWLYGFLVVALVAGNSGGFRTTTIGWCAIGTLWLAAVAMLVRDRVSFGAFDLCYLGGLALFTGWVALSNLWTSSMTSTMPEVQRNLAYFGIVAAALVLVRRQTTDALLGGVLTAIALLSLYALGTRVLPDRIGEFDSNIFGYRLTTPISYWNGLGIFTVLGILLALGFALRARPLAVRAASAALLPLLVATMYFTFSRGAWGALVIGLVVTLLVDPRRVQFLAGFAVLAPLCAVAVVVSDRSHGLTTVGSTLAEATDDGHALVAPLLLLSAVSAGAAAVFALVERRVVVPRRVRGAFVVAAVALAFAGMAAVFVQEGAPWTLADRAWSSFTAHPKPGAPDVSDRLFQLSSNGRLDLWKTSLDSARNDPLLGHGAGTFEQLWAASPRQSFSTTEGHSLYLETLGEMGVVGLGLVLLTLAVPLVAILSVRRAPLAAAAGGAYVAFLAHAGADWDWELVGVTSAALLIGVALVRSVDSPTFKPMLRGRIAGAAILGVLAVCAIPQLIAELRLEQAQEALAGNPALALERAQAAKRWVPWSSVPFVVSSDANMALQRVEPAREALREALDRDPGDWHLWSQLAVVGTESERAEARRRVAVLSTRK